MFRPIKEKIPTYYCKLVLIKIELDMKWSEMRTKAEENGWMLERHGKKHDIYYHPDKDFKIQLERHGVQEVKKGLYHDLKKKIGF